MPSQLLSYYEGPSRRPAGTCWTPPAAATGIRWSKLEGARAAADLAAQARRHAPEARASEEAQLCRASCKAAILVNDAEIRHLADTLAGPARRAARRPHQDRPLNLPRDIDIGNPADAAGVAVRQQWRAGRVPHHRAARSSPAQAVPGRQPAAQPERQQRRDALHHAVVARPDARPAQLQRRCAGADDATPGPVECDEAVAVATSTASGAQFDVQASCSCAAWAAARISARLPRELFRFQRLQLLPRAARLLSVAGGARAYPVIAEMRLALRVIDVSIGGCALFLPDVPAITARHGDEPGADRPRRRRHRRQRAAASSVHQPEAKGAAGS